MKTYAKRIIALLLVAATLIALPVFASAAQVQFKDVPSSFWGYKAIMTAAEAGLVKGKSTNSDGSMNYAPNDTMTRAEFVTTILRLFYKDEAAAVTGGAKWWTGYYDLAKAKGVLKEGELDSGDLDKPMTREEMALVLYRTAPTMDAYMSVTMASVTAIPDYFSVTNVYKEAVLWVYGAKLIQGMDAQGTFAPQNSLTRAQSASILAKLVENSPDHVPSLEVEETLANRQKAMIDTAMAYYHKNPYVQYDWIQLHRQGRGQGARYHRGDRNAPEYASEDYTVFAVCSLFVSIVTENTFGLVLGGSPENTITSYLSKGENIEPKDIVVFTMDNQSATPEENKAAIEKVKGILQPGDIVTYFRPDGTGHAVIYSYDVTGDGKDDIIHCNGEHYDVENGLEHSEANGGIQLNLDSAPDAERFLFGLTSSEALTHMSRYSVVRPAALDPKQYPITEATKTRMAYEGLAVSCTADKGFYGAVEAGKEMTYTLTLKNNSTKAHAGLKVDIPVPRNAVITKVDGKEVSSAALSFTLSVPTGGTVQKTYTVKATGKVGDLISTGGTVHAIKLPVIETVISSYTPDAAAFSAEAARTAAASAANKVEAFANAFYNGAGKTANLPTMQDVQEKIFIKQSVLFNTYLQPRKPEQVTADVASLHALLVNDYYGGRNLSASPLESYRVLETRMKDLMVGDVLYVQKSLSDDTTAAAWVYDGTALWALESGTVAKKSQLDIMKLHSYDFFCLLRPCQMG